MLSRLTGIFCEWFAKRPTPPMNLDTARAIVMLRPDMAQADQKTIDQAATGEMDRSRVGMFP
jgi:hypothetical protein